MTIKELISKLSKYDQDTWVCGGYTSDRGTGHFELVIEETHPIGDRDTEEQLMILLGYEKECEEPIEIPIEDIVDEIFINVNNRSATEREMDGIKYGIRLACNVIDYTKYKLGNEALLAELKTLEL